MHGLKGQTDSFVRKCEKPTDIAFDAGVQMFAKDLNEHQSGELLSDK
ncbi:hypothetical protein GRAN_3047 [Granulicella sibirica]|uniref:Uncharacterized protein n=1 Tax=Granulicella sibirica TaxID=2479048 RepID=A0A4Q0T1F6_9BACT|nr:hypothetical protein GRAN_3047 [Granulicella sibirica]